MATQTELTFTALIPVTEEDGSTLDQLGVYLSKLASGSAAANSPSLDFAKVPGLHFAHVAVVDAGVRGGRVPALLIATRFDDPDADGRAPKVALLRHLGFLSAALGPAWLDILRYCDDAPGTSEQVPAYLWAHVVPEGAAFAATRGHSVSQIVSEAALKEQLRKRLDERRATLSEAVDNPQLVRRDLVNRVPGLGWLPLEVPDTSPLAFWGVLFLVLLLVWLPITLPLLGAYLLWLRFAETRDPAVLATSPSALPSTSKPQEILTLLVPLKAGVLRRLTLKTLLRVLEAMLSALGVSGRPGPFASLLGLHYASFRLAADGQQLLVVAVTDPGAGLATLEGLPLFALNAILSNTEGFPRTEFLVFGGAADKQSFEAWLSQYQVESSVEYRAYPAFTVREILDNTDVRRGLADSRSQIRMKDWVEKIHA